MFVQSIDTGLVRRYNVQLVFYARGEAGAAGALGDGDRLESRDVEAGTGRFEFPEDGEHWSTIWTGGVRLQEKSHVPQHAGGTASLYSPPANSQFSLLSHEGRTSMNVHSGISQV